MTTSTADVSTSPDESVGIAEVAAATGLTQDTLRWYEKEGLLPAPPRGTDGRRRYDPAAVRLVQLLVRLRRTGLPVAQMRAFSTMVAEGAATHGRRRALLAEHRTHLLASIAQLHDDLAALDAKIEHYDDLIARGLDCGEEPITDPLVRAAQAATR
ncbi:MerR family transcriptional regulator [Nocardioides sp. GXZ039]|uniref:MerR family transcriptional regulator n=1 Tax=Nocardioides sp. GXZ039 TaxID=3136018 RepID=UPI0030F43992